MAPGRITRGRRPVQSTTVDGADGVERPPSSTRSMPRATASRHCSTISPAVIAGGTPGQVRARGRDRVAVARESGAASAGCDVQRTAMPPSGPRRRGWHAPLAAAAARASADRASGAPRGAPRSSAGAGRAARACRCPTMSSRNGFAGGRPFSATRRSTDVAVDRAAEAVDGLGRIREHLPRLRGARACRRSDASISSGDQNGIGERVAHHSAQREQSLRRARSRLPR